MLHHSPRRVQPEAHRAAHRPRGEPRWPATLAVLAVGGIYVALPGSLRVGPPWLLLAVVTLLLVPTVLAHRTGRHALNAWLGHAVGALLSTELVLSIGRLVADFSERVDPSAAPRRGLTLLTSAAALWVANVLVFASWYWRLDAGGPNGRDRRRHAGEGHRSGAFLFPQMTTDDPAHASWSPHFVDYLFLAFTVSTAFSPTDAPVLSRWAKLLMMVQALIAVATLAVLAAHAVNIL